MRKCRFDRLLILVLFACLTSIFLPDIAFGQATLNGVKINDSFDLVLAAIGSPQSVGPSLASIAEVNNILRPPPVSTGFTGMDIPGMPPVGSATPIAPPNMPPTMAPPSSPWGTEPTTPVDPTADLVAKGRSNYICWMYTGNIKDKPDPKSGWATYVLFNRGLGRSGRFNAGKVASVTVWLYDLSASGIPAAATTYNGIGLGAKMSAVTDRFGFPNPMIKIGNTFALSYSGVTYSVDATTRKVIGICLFDKLLTLVPNFTSLLEELPNIDTPGGMPGMPGMPGGPGMPGTLPGMPNGMPASGYPGGMPPPPGRM